MSTATVVKIIKALMAGPKSGPDLTRLVGFRKPSTVTPHLRALHQAKLVHITLWRHNTSGTPAAVWGWGEGPDAPRPPLKHPQHARKRETKAAATAAKKPVKPLKPLKPAKVKTPAAKGKKPACPMGIIVAGVGQAAPAEVKPATPLAEPKVRTRIWPSAGWPFGRDVV